MKRTTKYYIVLSILSAIVLYLIASFIKWDLNAEQWDEGLRFTIASIWSAAQLPIYFDVSNKIKD